MTKIGHRIGFVGARFAGTDGVSLESAKWAQVLWDHRHVSYWYAGKQDRSPSVSMTAPLAYFGHPEIQWITDRVFGHRKRTAEVTRRIYALADHLKNTLYEFTERFEVEILIAQNCLSIPMNIPLGVALTHFIAETGFPTIAHHHDFFWERSRFAVNGVDDFLQMAFPATLPSIQHVTINTPARLDLSHRTGASSVLVPNVLDFENAPPEPDEYTWTFRKDIGLSDDDILFLQPTRVVPRKGIEHSIALVAALKDPRCKLVVSHASGDEGDEYRMVLEEMAHHQGVDIRFVGDRVGDARVLTEGGDKIYTLADAYSQADIITYPSLYEGFGNALLEAFYYRKPVMVNRYSIYITDIEPQGAKVIAMDGIITRDVVNHVRKTIEDEKYRQNMVNHNYELGRAFYSYSVLRRKLRALITNVTGLEDL